MNIQISTNFNQQPSYAFGEKVSFQKQFCRVPDCDKFEMSTNPTFTGKKVNRKEQKKIEETLKNIDGLHDPYSDVIMISSKKYKSFQSKLNHRNNASAAIYLLNDYTQHMFPSDKDMFEIIKQQSKSMEQYYNKSDITFHTILQELEPKAKVRLINDQFDVIDNIREISQNKLPIQYQKEVESYLTIIEKDIYYDRFRIKPSIKMLRNLYDEVPNKEVVDEIIKETRNFPNTATNTDAFIVKNANKTHKEIAELLVSPSLVSIEHIKPSSMNGESKGANYLAASRRMNNLRSSMPVEEFIDRFPEIPQCTQRYMDDLITKINRGGLYQVALTIPDVKQSLLDESHGLIDVDISALNPDVLKKIDDFKDLIGNLISHFKKEETT